MFETNKPDSVHLCLFCQLNIERGNTRCDLFKDFRLTNKKVVILFFRVNFDAKIRVVKELVELPSYLNGSVNI